MSVLKLYAEQLIAEYEAIMDWHCIIKEEQDTKRLADWVHFAEEEHKHYTTLRELMPQGDTFSGTATEYFDREVEEAMMCISKYKK